MRAFLSPLIFICLSSALLLLSGCAMIAGGYRVPEGSTQARSYSSVAGDVDVGRRARVRNIDTVAGDIDIGEGGKVASIDSVAGDVRLAGKVTVEGSIETVAGDIDIEAGCTVGGGIDTVAGDIRIVESLVKGDVTTRHGDLELTRSRIEGVVRVKRARTDENDILRINIGAGSEAREIIVEERALVRLKIHRSAKVGKITGAEAEYYD